MAFAVVDSWQGSGSVLIPVAAPAKTAWQNPSWVSRLDLVSRYPIVGRGLAFASAAMIGAAVMAALAGFLDRAAFVRALPDALPLAVILESPVTSEQAGGTAAARVMQAAVSTSEPSPIETSTLTPASRMEWTVTRIPIVSTRPRSGDVGAMGTAGQGQSGNTQGRANGGVGTYDPYAGAAPRRRPPALARNADVIVQQVIDTAIAAVRRRYPGTQAEISMLVRLSPKGVVLDVQVEGGVAPALADALRTELLGKRLALMDAGLGAGATEKRLNDIAI